MMLVPIPIVKNCIFADNSEKCVYKVDYEKKICFE